MQKVSDYDIKQAIGIVARLGGFTIKSVATSDDLKERTLTVKIVRVSDGWVQETIDFEDIPAQLATIDSTNGHVDKVETPDDGWKNEAAESLAAAGAAEAVREEREAELPAGDQTEKVGEATGEPREGIEAKVIDTIPIDQTDEGKPDIHLVGEAAALGKKRR